MFCHITERFFVTGRVVHCKREPFDVYIGRPSRWGNPFEIGRDGTRADVIEKYRQMLLTDRLDLASRARRELRGKVLGCWCAPEACHGDVLLEIAASEEYPPRAVKAHGGRTDAGANGLPTPASFAGLENREAVIAKPRTNSEDT